MAEVRCAAARAEAGRRLFGRPAGASATGCTCAGPMAHDVAVDGELRRAFELPTRLAAGVVAASLVAVWLMSRRMRAASDG